MVRVHLLNLFCLVLPVALPNLFFLFFPPKNISKPKIKKSRLFTVFQPSERIGRVSIFILPVFYTADFTDNKEKVLLAIMVFSLMVYYVGWIRFFAKGRDYAGLYAPLLYLPIPLAISPMIYFACAAIAMKSILIGAAVVILAAGHIPISYLEFKRTSP